MTSSVRSASSIGSYNGSIVVPHDGGGGTVRSICSTSSQGSTFTSAHLPYDCYSSVSSAGSYYTVGQQPYDNGREQITQEPPHTYVEMVESESVHGSSAPVPSTPAPGLSAAAPGPSTPAPGPSTPAPGPSTPAPGPSASAPRPRGVDGRGFSSKLGHSRSNLPQLLDTFKPQVQITINKKLIDKEKSEETGCDEVLNDNPKSVETAEDIEQGLSYELTDVHPTNIPQRKTNLCRYIAVKIFFLVYVISLAGFLLSSLALLPLIIWFLSHYLVALYLIETIIVMFMLYWYRKPIGRFFYSTWSDWSSF